jgi:hypothetical protein
MHPFAEENLPYALAHPWSIGDHQAPRIVIADPAGTLVGDIVAEFTGDLDDKRITFYSEVRFSPF